MTTAKAKAEPKETVQTADAVTGKVDPVQEQTQPAPAEAQTSTTPSTPDDKSSDPQLTQHVPSVGRVVHYVIDPELPPLAAIVTAVNDDQPEGTASLVIFKEHLQFFRKNLAFDPSGEKSNTWHWPARV